MPVVTVDMWPGRSVEQKRALVKSITKAMAEHAKVDTEHLHIIIHEVPKDCWGRNGALGIDNEPD